MRVLLAVLALAASVPAAAEPSKAAARLHIDRVDLDAEPAWALAAAARCRDVRLQGGLPVAPDQGTLARCFAGHLPDGRHVGFESYGASADDPNLAPHRRSKCPRRAWRARLLMDSGGLREVGLTRLGWTEKFPDGDHSSLDLELAPDSAAALAALTRAAVAPGAPPHVFAVMVGDRVLTAPRVVSPIERARVFLDLDPCTSDREASDLVVALRAGFVAP